jgi:hypothetical protein
MQDIANYIQTIVPDASIYIGTLDANQEKCIGLYVTNRIPSILGIGGANNISYRILSIDLLVHWTENSIETMNKANEIYEKLEGVSNITLGNTEVVLIEPIDSSPVDLYKDVHNISEALIRLTIYYKK